MTVQTIIISLQGFNLYDTCKDNAVSINVITRVFIALFGGFLLANLAAISIAQLPAENKVDAIVAGMMVSFIVYTLTVIFVFSTQSLRRVSLGVFVPCAAAFGFISSIDVVIKL